MKDEKYIYYWYCPACKDYELKFVRSISEARSALEKHEEEKHEGKHVGTFGKARGDYFNN